MSSDMATARASLLAGPMATESAVKAAWRLLDVNEDGIVMRNELTDGAEDYLLIAQLLQLPDGMTQETITAIFDNIDLDKEGSISAEEWRQHFCPDAKDGPSIRMPVRYIPDTGVTGFLIDLDGTTYRPGSLIPGAEEFYRWLVETETPYVFLSNTGAKGRDGTQKKLMTPPYKIADKPVPKEKIYTAADAQIAYMLETIPCGSKVLIVSGGKQFWRDMFEVEGKTLFESWIVKTHLTDGEAEDWAIEAKQNAKLQSKTAPQVVVAFFVDGEVDHSDGGWNYRLIKRIAFLLNAGAKFIYTADDPFNPHIDHERHSDHTFPLPGPGMFASMFKPCVSPKAFLKQFKCLGKGGNLGMRYMMEKGIELLKSQGHDGKREKIMMVGDRFSTDIRGGVHVGIKTCLVLSGCNQIPDQDDYPFDSASFYAKTVGDLVPKSFEFAPAHRT